MKNNVEGEKEEVNDEEATVLQDLKTLAESRHRQHDEGGYRQRDGEGGRHR